MKKAMLILIAVLSLCLGYFANRYGTEIEASAGNVIERFNAATEGVFPAIAEKPLYIGTGKIGVILGIFGVAVVWMMYLYHAISKNYRRGEEHGSAHWAKSSEIKPLTDPVDDMNIPLSATEQISVRKVKDFNADRNKNIVVVGGSGSGKTYSEILPSIMQLHSSYVITDPKMSILTDTGDMLLKNGYELTVFNTIDFSKSMHYNPLAYIHSEKDILKVVNVLIENTKGEGSAANEDFWIKSERLFYTAIIAYLWQEAPPEECNIQTMLTLINSCDVREDDPEYKSPVDILFDDLEQVKPDCLAVRQYKKFKLAAGKTLKSILISCAARLAAFDLKELREITEYDELHLDELGDRRSAFFIIMSDTDKTYSFLIAMIMYQMFNLLCERADNEYGGQLPYHVRCLLDEFANIGKIPDFEVLISTIRSRQISAMIGLQSLSQLKAAYRDHADTILDNCDTMIFLGGKSVATTEQIARMIGKETVATQNTTDTKGGSYSVADSILARDLIDPAEIGRLQRTDCLVLITGLPPFRSKKYPTNKHKRFSQIASGGAPEFHFTHDCNAGKNILAGVDKLYNIKL